MNVKYWTEMGRGKLKGKIDNASTDYRQYIYRKLGTYGNLNIRKVFISCPWICFLFSYSMRRQGLSLRTA